MSGDEGSKTGSRVLIGLVVLLLTAFGGYLMYLGSTGVRFGSEPVADLPEVVPTEAATIEAEPLAPAPNTEVALSGLPEETSDADLNGADSDVVAALEPELVEPSPEPDMAPDIANVEPDPETATTEPDPAASDAPRFDIVRVEADGSTVIAGKAAPGVVVNVILGGEVVGTAEADRRGGFVALLDLGASNDPRTLSLVYQNEAGEDVASGETVILAPSPEVVADAATGTAATEDSSTKEPEAPTVLLADGDGVKVLQGADLGPEAMQNVAVDTITYDDVGDVVLSGRGSTDGFVNVYIDNQPIRSTEITQDGQWRTALPEIDTGVYTLRIDEVDADGVVQSRVETPFKREPAEDIVKLAQSRVSAPSPIELLTVQPGNTLWGISTNELGGGELYVKLFEANKDRIKDPDLIYPGQVFTIPN